MKSSPVSAAVMLTALLAAAVSGAPAGAQQQRRQQQPDVAVVTVTQTVPAAQATAAWTWNAGGSRAWPLHPSCNATERALLTRGLDDAAALAAHARDHVLRFGNASEYYRKYFGAAPTAMVVGWYEKIVNGDRSKFMFRCDDVDGNCALPGWGGHWRGENATEETVICAASYTTRRPLEGLCGYGYTVATGALNAYFGADLIHRLYHMPSVGEDAVGHLADDYADCLALARTDPAGAARNSHSLQYFALDVYAYDIAVPGQGCTGRPETKEEEEEDKGPANTAAPTPAASATPSATSTAAAECHTHSDGEVHCV